MTISVCIPATRAESLRAAIESVQAQTFPEWEVVVLGQGNAIVQAQLRSVTETAAGGDRRIRYVQLAHRGLSIARNAAMREAQGTIVAFLDDDCEADPDWLLVVATAFADDPDLGVVGGAVVPAGIPHPLSSCPSLAPSESIYDPAGNPRSPPAGLGLDRCELRDARRTGRGRRAVG